MFRVEAACREEVAMRLGTCVLLALLSAIIFGAGCATQKQWSEWDRHSTQFASGQHMWFSLSHQGQKTPPSVTRRDLDNARRQAWWGDQVPVRPREVSQR
jgi:hypothetical protein